MGEQIYTKVRNGGRAPVTPTPTPVLLSWCHVLLNDPKGSAFPQPCLSLSGHFLLKCWPPSLP